MKQLITGTFDALQTTFLKIIGDIKYHPWPLFFIYDPKGFQVKGYEVREVINTVRPGDILLRGYDKYLSDLFIPGYFSHAALYLGEVRDNALDHIDQVFTEDQLQHFGTGEQMVVHAMAQGVFMEDIIDFCRCDRLIILRFPEIISDQRCEPENTEPMAETFSIEEYNLYRDLKAGISLSFAEVYPVIYRAALKQVGKPYDFKFNFDNYNDLSCTEYVQSCIKSLAPFHGIAATEKHYFGLLKKSVIEPDAFFRDCFELVWQSQSTNLKKMKQSATDESR